MRKLKLFVSYALEAWRLAYLIMTAFYVLHIVVNYIRDSTFQLAFETLDGGMLALLGMVGAIALLFAIVMLSWRYLRKWLGLPQLDVDISYLLFIAIYGIIVLGALSGLMGKVISVLILPLYEWCVKWFPWCLLSLLAVMSLSYCYYLIKKMRRMDELAEDWLEEDEW